MLVYTGFHAFSPFSAHFYPHYIMVKGPFNSNTIWVCVMYDDFSKDAKIDQLLMSTYNHTPLHFSVSSSCAQAISKLSSSRQFLESKITELERLRKAADSDSVNER